MLAQLLSRLASRAAAIYSGKRSAAKVPCVHHLANGWVDTEIFALDAIAWINGKLIISGWKTRSANLCLYRGNVQVPLNLHRTSRLDVEAEVGKTRSDAAGFFGSADISNDDVVELVASTPRGRGVRLSLTQLLHKSSLHKSSREQTLSPGAVPFPTRDFESLTSLGSFPEQFNDNSDACGTIEYAAYSEYTGMLVIAGWAARLFDNESVITVSPSGSGGGVPQGIAWYLRPDVCRHLESRGMDATNARGFVGCFKMPKPANEIRLVYVGPKGYHVLASAEVKALSNDPVAASRILFSIAPGVLDFKHQVEQVYEPALRPLIDHDRDCWQHFATESGVFGDIPHNPRVSVIIPLYGRSDFVEHQLFEFSRDAWFLKNVELIYVLDDPALKEKFLAEAGFMHSLSRVPFRWVWGGRNRGFSGANNLGASISECRHLLFLNSDVFPISPGWLETLMGALDNAPGMGAIGARLLHADGSIQHEGMTFAYRDDLGVWINHHPLAGLDPDVSVNNGVTTAAAITGACLLMSRNVFDSIGGWSADYLVGDFEDSDLCIKISNAGMTCGLHSGVSLIHLERQSMGALGEDEFRTRVTLFNAVRHQQLWGRQLLAASTTRQKASIDDN